MRKGATELRENNLRVTQKCYVSLPYNICEADVPEYNILFYWVGDYVDSNVKSLNGSEEC